MIANAVLCSRPSVPHSVSRPPLGHVSADNSQEYAGFSQHTVSRRDHQVGGATAVRCTSVTIRAGGGQSCVPPCLIIRDQRKTEGRANKTILV